MEGFYTLENTDSFGGLKISKIIMNGDKPFLTCQGQDGAIRNDELFRLNADGVCRVYSLLEKRETACFTLDKCALICPHSNSVTFGSAYAENDDAYPLMYTNIYNNYSNAADRLEGVCCVYRLLRNESGYASKLIQIIRIGFTEDLAKWKSLPNNGDVRPYGNFAADPETNSLIAFVMRDKERVTRFFKFALPKPEDGEMNEKYGVPVVTLNENDILLQFDTCYFNYLQGACCAGGMLFSVEGFDGKEQPACLRAVDLKNGKLAGQIDLFGIGLDIEPEFIAPCGDILYYSNARGELYKVLYK